LSFRFRIGERILSPVFNVSHIAGPSSTLPDHSGFIQPSGSFLNAQNIENMERETGIEPATSSLGMLISIQNKELMRPWTTILIICTHGNHRFRSKTRLNELIELSRAVRVLALENQTGHS
jgi:hypothetical protein